MVLWMGVIVVWIAFGKISVPFWEGFFETELSWKGICASIVFAPVTLVFFLYIGARLLCRIIFK